RQEVDVARQVVDLMGEIDRNANSPDRRVDPLELEALGADVGGGIGRIESALQRAELAVPVQQALANAPDVECGDGLYHRQSNGEQRDQQQNGLRPVRIGKGGQGEWQTEALVERSNNAQQRGQFAALVHVERFV